MKKLLIVFVCGLFLYGCGGSSDTENPANSGDDVASSQIEVSLGENKWLMNLPANWEKIPAYPEKGVIFLARRGTQNLVITHEKGYTDNLIETLFQTTAKSLDIIEKLEQTEDSLIFRGKLSATTPMREFYQKILVGPQQKKFLLVSCSQEVANLDELDCPDILDSIALEEPIEE